MGNSVAARHPGRGCKTRPHHQPSTTICDSWYEAFSLMCLIFSKCALWPSNSTLASSVQKDVVFRGLSRYSFSNVCWIHYREKRKGFLLVTLFLLVKWLGFLRILWDILFWEGIYPWYCAYMHLQAPEQRTAKNSAFILTVGTTLLLLILLITKETLTFT